MKHCVQLTFVVVQKERYNITIVHAMYQAIVISGSTRNLKTQLTQLISNLFIFIQVFRQNGKC